MPGGSAKGLRPSRDGSIGDITAVCSAKRAALGDASDGALDAPEADRERTDTT
jgi:hypothetical protein